MRRLSYRTIAVIPAITSVQALLGKSYSEDASKNEVKKFEARGHVNTIHPPSFAATNTRTQKSSISNSSLKHPVTLNTLSLISGTAHRDLAQKISHEIDVPICNATVTRFADGEVSVQIHDNIRGQDVYIVQTCAAPVNDSIMELLLTVSCARRANVGRITAIIPYFGYKHHRRGSSISTKHSSRFLWSGAGDFAEMLKQMGVDRVISVDLQRPGQGLESCFFDNSVPVETILSHELFMNNLIHKQKLQEPVTIVAPNAECFNKARKYQATLQKHFPNSEIKLLSFFADDTGSGPIDASHLSVIGDLSLSIPEGDVVIVDDMVDTAGTLQALSEKLNQAGAKRIFVCASHGLFNERAVEIINTSPVVKVLVTDSLPLPKTCSDKIEQVTLAKYLAQVILSEHFSSVLFQEEEFEQE